VNLSHHVILYLILLYSSDEKPLRFQIHLNVVFHVYYNSRTKLWTKFVRVYNWGDHQFRIIILNRRETYIYNNKMILLSIVKETRRLLSRKGYSVIIGQASYQNYKLNRYGTPLYYCIIHVLDSAVFNRLRCVFSEFCGYSHTQLWCRRFDCSGCNIIAISPITRRPGIALPRLY